MSLLASRLKQSKIIFFTILIAKDSNKFRDTRCEDLDCMKLAQNKIQALPNTIIKLYTPWKIFGLTSGASLGL